jgi:Family of unknown function (DUF5670)
MSRHINRRAYDERLESYVRRRTAKRVFKDDTQRRSKATPQIQARRSTNKRALPAVEALQQPRIFNMLYTIAVVLVILWLLGLVTSYTIGGFIHVLLVIAIVVVLLRVISGRKPI